MDDLTILAIGRQFIQFTVERELLARDLVAANKKLEELAPKPSPPPPEPKKK